MQRNEGGLLLGDWHYWPDSGVLKKPGQEQRLSTQLNQVLQLLLERAPAVVTRQQFLDQVWTNKYVNEDALSRTIAELRKLLGDSASQAKYIKTIPKTGYQLTASYEPLQAKRQRRWQGIGVMLAVVVMLGLTVWFSQSNRMMTELQTAVANASRVTAKPGMEQQSLLSPDGQWLSYVTHGSGQSQIIIQSMSTANQQHVVELARHRLASPVYVPEQHMVYFTAQDQNRCYLSSYDLHSQQFTELSHCLFNTESRTLDWDPEQQRLLLSASNAQQQVAIHQFSLSAGELRQLTEPVSSDEQDWSPKISPDRQWLSFSRGNHAVRNLWLRDLQSGEERAVTFGEHYSVSHDWLDESHVVFDSDASGSRQLWVLNIDDLSVQLLGAYGAQHPSFNQDKTLMTFQEVSYEANIWQFDVETQSTQRLVHSTKYDNNPAFSPDGSQFVFSSNRQDIGSIWLYDYATASEQLLVSQAGAKLTRPAWTSDGGRVLITTNDERGYGTLVYHMAKQTLEELPFGAGHMAAAEHQGHYFALAKSGDRQHQIMHWYDGELDVLPPVAVSRFMVLSDGRLVFSKTDQNGLFIYEPVTAEQRQLTAELRVRDLNFWTVVNQAVYFDRDTEETGLWRLDVDSGDLQLITTHRPYSVGTSLSVNATEDLILITHTDRAESDVLKTTLP